MASSHLLALVLLALHPGPRSPAQDDAAKGTESIMTVANERGSLSGAPQPEPPGACKGNQDCSTQTKPNCVEGVCCNTPCDDSCDTCVGSNQLPGGGTGICWPSSDGGSKPDGSSRCPTPTCDAGVLWAHDAGYPCGGGAYRNCDPASANRCLTECNSGVQCSIGYLRLTII